MKSQQQPSKSNEKASKSKRTQFIKCTIAATNSKIIHHFNSWPLPQAPSSFENVSSHPPIPKPFVISIPNKNKNKQIQTNLFPKPSIISIPQQTPRSMKSRQQASKSNEKASKSKQKQRKKTSKNSDKQANPSNGNEKTSRTHDKPAKTKQKQWKN